MDTEKHRFTDVKSTSRIPTPVVACRHENQRNKGKWFYIVLTILLSGAVHLWIRSSFTLHPKYNEHSEHLGMFEAYACYGDKADQGPLRGKRAEKLFLSIPGEESALAASRLFAGKPHMAGTPGDLVTAKDFLALLQRELGASHPSTELPIFAAGSDESRAATLNISFYNEPKAWIDTYYPILNSPLDRSLEILGEDGKVVWSAELEEIADETDPYAYEYATAVPTWHGLSRGGEAQGKLIYANYGRKEDYDALVDAGIDFIGKIVITRYGGIFRGLKVKRAQELGAAAVLIYSDPRDDGTVTTENGYVPYPHGPARNPTSVQRGSVQFLSLYPGDPSTPGYPSYENSTRVEGGSKPIIPSLPISWANAKVLLKHIVDGSEGPTVRLINNVDEKITPIWNAMGVIPGHIRDEVVVLGNHRDAWVLGASDPSSGTVSVHEAVRGFGALLRKGWKPLRTILIASWDGEEYGLIGSTEWGEDFTEWIRDHVIAYVNLDTSAAGSRLRASASPLLAHLLRKTAEQIPHPTSQGRSLWDAHLDSGTLFGEKLDAEVVTIDQESQSASDSLGVNPLGSGSDYTVFLQHIGVPSAEAGFKSTLHDPVYHYHSVFDSQHWQEVYGDPDFSRHVAIAKHIGLQVLRLCDDIILPLNTTHYAHQLEAYLERVETISAAASIDVNLSPLRKSIKALQTASARLDIEKTLARQELEKALHRYRKRRGCLHRIRRRVCKIVCKLKRVLGRECRSTRSEQTENQLRFLDERLTNAVKRVQAVNGKLIAFERCFISMEGIKDREWYKHLGVAPGKWLGYGATTLPGLTEAITIDGDEAAASWEAERLKVVVDNLIKGISM